jgi:hypothetical protein
MSRISTKAARAAVASGLVLAVATPVVAPAIASAAPSNPTTTKIVRTYQVRVHPGVLAKGQTVKARVVIRNPQANVKGWYSKATIARVVRKGVDNGYEMPYTSRGYRVTPSVHGQNVSFTGKLRGADVPTTIKLKFNVRYAG